jgi:hypothetical protein
MKFTPILLLWSVGLIQLTFLIALCLFDTSITNTVYYKLSLFINGLIFGVVIENWLRS